MARPAGLVLIRVIVEWFGDGLSEHGGVARCCRYRAGCRVDIKENPKEDEDICHGGDRREVEESGVMLVQNAIGFKQMELLYQKSACCLAICC